MFHCYMWLKDCQCSLRHSQWCRWLLSWLVVCRRRSCRWLLLGAGMYTGWVVVVEENRTCMGSMLRRLVSCTGLGPSRHMQHTCQDNLVPALQVVLVLFHTCRGSR